MTTMTAKQYRAAIKKLGLSQVAAGHFLGVSPRHSRRWAGGDAEVGETAAKLLRVMLHYELTPAEVDAFAEPKHP